jgi:hypothetical protein
VIVTLREQIHGRLDQLFVEAERFREALAALGSRRHAPTREPPLRDRRNAPTRPVAGNGAAQGAGSDPVARARRAVGRPCEDRWRDRRRDRARARGLVTLSRLARTGEARRADWGYALTEPRGVGTAAGAEPTPPSTK